MIIRDALDLAYDRNTFVGGSSVFSLSMYEVQLWDYYHTYVKTPKIDRLELPLAYAGAGTGKFKSVKKIVDVMCRPLKPKKSAMELFSRGRFLKKKGK